MTKSPPIRRILWLSTTLSQVGGGERLVLEGARHFENRGIETTIVTFKWDDRARFDGAYDPRVIQLLPEPPDAAGRGPFAALRYWGRGLRALRAAIRRARPDIIIAQSDNSAVLLDLATLLGREPYALLLFGQMFQFPWDLTKYARVFRPHLPEIRASQPGYQATIPLDPPPLCPFRRCQIELLALARYHAVRRAAVLLTMSDQTRWELQRLYGRDAVAFRGAYPARIFDYQPPPDLRRRLGLPDGPLILTISRLVPKKRVDLVIEAFARLAAQRADLTLVIGGRGFDEPRLRQLVAERGLAERVHFAGYIPERAIWDYYAAGDVFVQMDVADFDLVSYEALAIGRKAVLAREVDLAGTLDNHRFLFLADPEPAALAATIERALAVPLEPLTPAERATLAEYTWERYFDRFLECLTAARG